MEQITEKDSTTMSVIDKRQTEDNAKLSVVGHADDWRVFVASKTRKLASVLYMVSSFFPEQEPLKWQLRSSGIALITHSGDLQKKNSRESFESAERMISVSDTLISFLSVLHTCGYISDMNSQVLREEFSALKSFLKERNEKERDAPVVSEGDLSLQTLRTVLAAQEQKEKSVELVSGEVKQDLSDNHSSTPVGGSVSVPESPAAYLKVGKAEEGQSKSKSGTATLDKGQLADVGYKPAQEEAKEDGGHFSRRELLLSFMKGKNEYTIKDIALYIPGVSEKTVQRDLQSLVSAGVLRRKGERRWSRYMRS